MAPTAAAKNAETGYPQTGFPFDRPAEFRRLLCSRPYRMGRTLHVVDLDNLFGSRWRGPGWPLGLPQAVVVRGVLDSYRAAAEVRRGDHHVILATARLAVEAKLAVPSARVVLRRGSLAQAMPRDLTPDYCAARYGRVVLGSGDGSVVAVLRGLAERGVAVRVVAPPSCLSAALVRTDGVVAALPREPRPRRGGA